MTGLMPRVTIDEIREEVADLETPEERIGYLIELGQTVPDLPSEYQNETYRVLGCQSMVWVVPDIRDEAIYFRGSSDAPMVRGLVAILLAAYSGRTPQAILDFPIEGFFDEIHLRSFLTPMRSNGLHSMVQRIQNIARAILPAGCEPTAAPGLDASQDFMNPSIPQRSTDDCRRDFPYLSRRMESGKPCIYLDNAASSQRPQSVVDCMSRVYENHYANVHRSGHDFASETTIAMEASRSILARFVGAAGSEQVIFTSGTTASINLVARSWGDANIRAGDEILLTEMEHHSNIVPWQQLAQRTGAIVRWLPVLDGAHLDMAQLDTFLGPRTKLLSATAVSNVLGTINPVRALVDAAHRVGAKVLVDAAQSVPHGMAHAAAWDADWIAFSGHKMLGPTGIGVLYGKRELLEEMPPFLGGGNMIHSVTCDGFVPAGIPHRFEAGTAPIVEAIAMQPAVEYLQQLGAASILAHERQLAARAMEGLGRLPRVRLLGPESIAEKTGIVSFVVDGMHSDQIGQTLNAAGIAIRVGHHCAMPLHARLGIGVSCRASFYLYNTLDDADALVDTVARALR
jgi:cysteine desulfurase / selenocysteine lyase